MIKNKLLDKGWQKYHLKKIKQIAKNRYTPRLNIDLPIAEIFEGISRSENFYILIRENYGKLNREFGCVSSKHEDEEVQKIYRSLKREIYSILKHLKKLCKYNTDNIPWGKIYQRTQKAKKNVWKLSEKLNEKKAEAEKLKANDKQEGLKSTSERIDSDIYYLYKTQKELRYFEDLSSSTKAKLSNIPFLLITGTAGTGKTHLLCDIVEGRISNKKTLPSILVFGELFTTKEEPIGQVIGQLGLELNKTQFFRMLSNAGKQSACRAILAIDALNETQNQNFWKVNLNGIVNEVQKNSNVALVISVRSGFEEEVLTKKQRKVFVHEEHRGFQFREWEAVTKFFKEFKLPLPEIPLLTPEFQNPLFLLLFCKAFQDRTKRSKGNKKKQIIKGHEGATYIFEAFIDSVSKRLSVQFVISNSVGNNVWDAIIKKIAEKMVKENSDRISEDQLLGIVKKAYPTIDHARFIKELERNLLLVKVPRYSSEEIKYDGFDFRFPFQKFSDHLIGRYLFKKYETEFGKANKNLVTARKFFTKRRKLGKLLSKSCNRGFVEALSIQCPEHLKGCELVEVASYLKHSHLAQEAFVESMIWRNPNAFSADLKNTLAYINTEIIRTEWGTTSLLNTFLAVAPIPNHPFNADFLHKHLLKFSMAKRDSWWSTFLHYQYGEKGAVDRLIEWGWSEHDKTHIKDESIRLCSVALIWFLTTANRFLRDKSTKALVALLTNRLRVVLNLLKQFQDVNDPYVSERLYAVAYGCALRSSNDRVGIKNLAKWVYENIFQNGDPPAHIFMRDYALGIIEVALHEKIKMRIRRKRIYPPFNSEWPKKVRSEKLLKKKYYPEDFIQKKIEDRGFLDIWLSVMYNFGTLGDFGNYILNSVLDHWSGMRLDEKEINRNLLFDRFKKGLTKMQKELLEKATNPFFGVDFSKLLKSTRTIITDNKKIVDEKEEKRQEKEQKKEMKQAYDNFENTLSVKKKKFFNVEIKSYINDHGGINNPIEQFDTGLAQRWVFNRVVQLGWKQELHGQFDSYVNFNRIERSEPKAERIGKKYQWIAFHELLARISDHFKIKKERWPDKLGKYEGPWQLNIRDIDPSCILKEFPNTKPEGLIKFDGYEKQRLYTAWNKKVSNLIWLKETNDLPDPKQVIEFKDNQGNNWIALECFLEWQEEMPPEYEKYNFPTRKLWYIIKSYLVKTRDSSKVFSWAKKQHFIGRWMPESHEFYDVYLGEYPWAPAFLYHHLNYNQEGWTNGEKDKKIPAKILVIDDQYSSSGSSIDCSTNKTISIKLPAKFIVDEMNLVQQYKDGRFFDKRGDLVAFDPSVFDENTPRHLLMRKEKLCDFLKCKGYTVFWTLLGEKNIIGGGTVGKPLGLLEIDGAYTLNNRNQIVGTKTNSFKKSKS